MPVDDMGLILATCGHFSIRVRRVHDCIPRMVIVWYISGHGFGHASRDVEIINAIRRRDADCRIVLRTEVAPWLLHGSAESPIDVQRAEVDTGMAQVDSLTIDHERTATRAAAFYATFEARVDADARVLTELSATLVVGDIPPLACAAAARAGVASIAIGNFTWDWIYEGAPGFDALAPDVLRRIRHAYAAATLALRLPFHGGFEPMLDVTRDIPLVARASARGRDEARRVLGLSPDATVVLPSFGGAGLWLPYEAIADGCGCTLLVTDPGAGRIPAEHARLRVVGEQERTALGLRYEDLVAAADIVVSKPGYGIVSECVANATALLFSSRAQFAEEVVFRREMPRVLRCEYIEPERLRTGDWQQAIRALLDRPAPAETMRADGAPAAADAILAAARYTSAD
jgi:L-arabinokinase